MASVPLHGNVTAMWISVCVGTLRGLVLTLGAGLAKLLPFHPMHNTLKTGFNEVIGPYFGVPGDLIRTIIGLAHVSAGAGMRSTLWGNAFGLIPKKANIFGSVVPLADLGNALLICAAFGEAIISLGAAVFKLQSKGSVKGLEVVLLVMSITVLTCRMVVTPISTLLPDNAQVVYAFCAVAAVGLVLAVVMRCTLGDPLDSIQEASKRQDAKLEALKAGKGAAE